MLAELDDSGAGNNSLDLTLPGQPVQLGARHPISIVRNQIIEIFLTAVKCTAAQRIAAQ